MTEGPMTTGRMTYEQFIVSYERVLLDEYQALVLSRHLNRGGLLNLRSRLAGGYEFKPTPQREWLCLKVEELLGMRRAVPGDLAELDDLGDLPEPDEPEASP